jgi:hypothetical protein
MVQLLTIYGSKNGLLTVLNDQDFGFSPNNSWETIKPGQIPVIAANANKVAGTYKSQ